MERIARVSGGGPSTSDAYTINGIPGPFYPCSRGKAFKLKVLHGKTYLLRLINAALNEQLFFMVAGHKVKVVAVDASYTVPYVTEVVAIAPGQTVDALLLTDAAPGKYYMAARSYFPDMRLPFHKGTTAAVLHYESSSFSPSSPIFPLFPAFNDTSAAYKFYSSLSALKREGDPQVPLKVDEEMFVVIGLGLVRCDRRGAPCEGPFGDKFAASMNNNSFQLPDGISLLQAHFFNVSGVFTEDFPDRPVNLFDYTSPNVSKELLYPVKTTKAKRLKYGAVVEMVLQSTVMVGAESHPMHLHGFNFFVLGQGLGNYEPAIARRSFNLVNPLVRNTIAVPTGGWTVIRFVADNPGEDGRPRNVRVIRSSDTDDEIAGVWFMHCHIDGHMPWGLGMIFVVEDGPDSSSKLPPPPHDLPRC